ncbi:23S rRNA (guanosine(2251)-2'-O)-methyltransferase RlmB [Sodalis sp. CWE]|uniref:23S rRNA (guanosine(2251)-2'-O)-methyltransferase RlmB n=1 Tax=Sodalis sp. CWE TaxID=2803816 RepID=UPI001C7E18E2|nr:23S rRNA (guanosine(2251)-2'-O)-methyltransferase RlmB [Sodalis sp. CWE]MBX4180803.1 23S rRNA (guanosine(2251)-2'-O)-methyltransferase RlmB [Sodalis sp. CWE]
MSKIVYGIHAVQSILKWNSQHFINVYISKERKSDPRLQSLVKQLKNAGIVIQVAARKCLDKKANSTAHQGIIAHVQTSQFLSENDLSMFLTRRDILPLFLILDGVTDPRNFGACLRCADAAGVHAVIVPHNRAAPLNAAAKKAASGAAETVTLIRTTNLIRTLLLLKKNNVLVAGTSESADHSIYQSKLIGSLALVMGEEGKGIRYLTRKYCDEFINIPMSGTVSSLNVSVATGVCLFEIIRQRRKEVSDYTKKVFLGHV